MTAGELQAAVFRALGHPTRLRIVEILATGGGKCVCELVDMLGFDQSTISKHLAVLKSAGIVRCTKQGLKMIYELNMKCVYRFMKCIEKIQVASGGLVAAGDFEGCGLECGELESRNSSQVKGAATNG